MTNLSQMGLWINNKWFWNLEWRRTLFKWETEEERILLCFLEDNNLLKYRKESWVWMDEEKLVYTVISTYRLLRNEVSGEMRSLYENFWSIKALPSTQVVAWRILLDRLPTCVNLEGRGVTLVSKLCVMCGTVEETTKHIFFSNVKLCGWYEV